MASSTASVDTSPRGERAFIITIVVAFLVKVWLTSETRIVALDALYDASNFLVHAKYIALGQWFGPFDQYTLIKLPFFPVYMAGLSEFGIPLPIGHVIVYGLACFVACFAVKPLIRSPFMLSAMFVVLYFNPVEDDIYSWYTTRSQINPTVALLTLSCAIGLFVRRRADMWTKVRWAIALGASFAAFWLTREERIWMLAPLALLLCAFLYGPARARDLLEIRRRSVMVGIPVAMWAVGVGVVMLLNGTKYGWYITADQLAPEFVSGYESLARIDPGVPAKRWFPAPHAARLIAYRISPAARELEPSLEGTLGASWAGIGCQVFQACGDIHVGWFQWALRGAVSAAGHYTSGTAARAYYLRLASEIDAACDAHRITCRPKGHSLAPPIELSDIPQTASGFVTGTQLVVSFAGLRFEPNADPSSPSVRADYDFIARSVDDGFPHEAAAKDDDFKRAALYAIAHVYQFAVPIWLLLVLLAVVARCVAIVLGRSNDAGRDYLLVTAALAVGFASMMLLLSIVAAVAFGDATFNPDYMSPLYAVLIAAACIVTAVEGPMLLRYRSKWLPLRKATA